MKHTTLILTLVALSLITFSLACQKEPATHQATESLPSRANSPTAEEVKSANFVDATSGGDIGYELAGIGPGDSTKMNLNVRNKTERTWEVKIEVGTKLKPDNGNVQQMVVTKEVEVHLEPHDEETIELEVSCLDISKAAPSTADTRWHLESSKRLAQFISCANDAVDYLKAEGEAKEAERRGLRQLALWKVRGATHDDWVEYYEKYQDFSAEEAERAIEESEPFLKKITDRCPSP